MTERSTEGSKAAIDAQERAAREQRLRDFLTVIPRGSEDRDWIEGLQARIRRRLAGTEGMNAADYFRTLSGNLSRILRQRDRLPIYDDLLAYEVEHREDWGEQAPALSTLLASTFGLNGFARLQALTQTRATFDRLPLRPLVDEFISVRMAGRTDRAIEYCDLLAYVHERKDADQSEVERYLLEKMVERFAASAFNEDRLLNHSFLLRGPATILFLQGLLTLKQGIWEQLYKAASRRGQQHLIMLLERSAPRPAPRIPGPSYDVRPRLREEESPRAPTLALTQESAQVSVPSAEEARKPTQEELLQERVRYVESLYEQQLGTHLHALPAQPQLIHAPVRVRAEALQEPPRPVEAELFSYLGEDDASVARRAKLLDWVVPSESAHLLARRDELTIVRYLRSGKIDQEWRKLEAELPVDAELRGQAVRHLRESFIEGMGLGMAITCGVSDPEQHTGSARLEVVTRSFLASTEELRRLAEEEPDVRTEVAFTFIRHIAIGHTLLENLKKGTSLAEELRKRLASQRMTLSAYVRHSSLHGLTSVAYMRKLVHVYALAFGTAANAKELWQKPA